MKDNERLSYLFRHREQQQNTEIKDKDMISNEKKAKEKESDK